LEQFRNTDDGESARDNFGEILKELDEALKDNSEYYR
jgi:hypothetical protein